MSGILSAASSEAVVLFSDGAVYDRTNVLVAIKRKVAVSERLPLAVATRGNFVFGEIVSKQIIRAAETVGFDEMLVGLEAAMQSFASSRRLDVLIAGVSETAGPVHRRFCNWSPAGGLAPLTLVDPGPIYLGFGSDGRPNGLKDMGIRERSDDEFWQTWLARNALQFFEFFRRVPVPIDPGYSNAERAFLIGGHVDMTIVGAGGVSVRRMHTWPDDKVGEKIHPFAKASAIWGTREAA